MARIHARKKGKASSKKPYVTESPAWVPLSAEEIVEIVVPQAKEGYSLSSIGTMLRDQYGVPDVKLAVGKSMLDICKENGVSPSIPEDLMNLMKKAVTLDSHIQSNKKDLHNMRSLHLTEEKIRRLSKYYVREGTLPSGWKYRRADAKLMVE